MLIATDGVFIAGVIVDCAMFNVHWYRSCLLSYSKAAGEAGVGVMPEGQPGCHGNP